MRNFTKSVSALCMLGLSGLAHSSIIGLDLIESGDNAVSEIDSVFNSADVNVVANSQVFSGAQGDGAGAQSAVFSSLNFNGLSMGAGFALTTGSADMLNSTTNAQNNTSANLGASGDADLQALASVNGLNTNIQNVNFYSFDFTLASGFNAVMLDFIFGTEEFPTQSVTDIFGIFVDDVNYAFFSDGTLVNNGTSASNFNNNPVGSSTYGVEFNGLSDVLSLIGLVDETRTVHTLKIAIADTSDTIYDSGAFISNLGATNSTVGGIGVTPVPSPTGCALFALGLFGTFMHQRRKS